MIEIKDAREIGKMRAACRAAAETLRLVGDLICAGMTTDDVNDIVHRDTLAKGGVPATLGYGGFPKSVCVSVNDVVCHGIPGSQTLRDGDIVNVDVTTILDGFHGDTNATFLIGQTSDTARFLVTLAHRAMLAGIAEVKHGARLGDVGAAIQEIVETNGCSVVRDFCGHGIGREFHMEPSVPNFGKRGTGLRMHAGQTLTVEPMVNLGSHEVKIDPDGWTARTVDGYLSAQFEHTVLVTRDGCEILTALP